MLTVKPTATRISLHEIDQPEPRHEFLLAGDLVIDMLGAVDQVGSGVLEAAVREFELIVRRQFAICQSTHVRNNADGVNASNIPKMIACSVVICRSLGRTGLQSNFIILEKYSPKCTNCVALVDVVSP